MAFDRKDTFNKVASVVAEKLNIPVTDIQETSTLQDLGAGCMAE